ncbi:MAG: hypothetical protein PHD95_03390 [Candidatus ainarchaeum sp.]|nr:hypothetical protein [Candidatus ainarchaeum sp.]
MPNITLSITDEMKSGMDRHSEVRWSNAVRAIIERKLRDFEEAERLVAKSRLAAGDIQGILGKVNRETAAHAKRLLHESNC